MKLICMLVMSLTLSSCVHGISTHGLIVPEQALLNYPLKGFDPYKQVRDYFFWWRSMPTIGLEKHRDWSFPYPFLPHQFSLQELAPSQGTSVLIGLLDNGVAASSLVRLNGTSFLQGHDYLQSVLLAPSCVSESSQKLCWPEFQELMHFCAAVPYKDYVKKVYATYTPDLITPSSLDTFIKKYSTEKYREKILNCLSKTSLVCMPDSITTPLSFLSVPDYTTEQKRVPYYADQQWLAANHGTYCAGLINATSYKKSIGIAPAAQIVSIKVTSPSSVHYNVQSLLRALYYVVQHSIPIVSLSYSMRNSGGHANELSDYLERIPFSCIACGNKTTSEFQENFIATLPGITARVGSFGMMKNTITHEYEFKISPFSLPPLENGWHVVLPGEAILSCCYPASAFFDPTLFVFMQGTSCATPLLAGFFSLMVAEFYPTLTYEQIKVISRHATVFLHDTPVWHTRSGAGTLDMRMALFMGHVLKKIVLSEKNGTLLFHDYVVHTRRYLLQLINDYGKEQRIGVHFEEGLIDFLQKARNKRHSLLYTQQNLEESIATTVKAVKDAVKKIKG